MMRASQLPESGEVTRVKCAEMSDKWNIREGEVHCFEVDNVSDMRKAMDNA